MVLPLLVLNAQHGAEGLPHGREGEHSLMHCLEGVESGRVGTSIQVGSVAVQTDPQTQPGPVCNGGKCHASNLLLKCIPPLRHGRQMRYVHLVGQDGRVCIPAILNHPQGPA